MLIEVSPGEVVDRLTILEIRLERVADPEKRHNVQSEYEAVMRAFAAAIPQSDRLVAMRTGLKEVNATLWEIEDNIRDHERRQDFGPAFVELARSVYRNNDRRSALKRQINEFLGSAWTEEKSYIPY